MTENLNTNFFLHYGKYFSSQNVKKNAVIPFKDHPQFPTLIDILSRKNTHHAILLTDFSCKIHLSFLEAFCQHLMQDFIPTSLQGAELIYLDIQQQTFTKDQQKTIEQDFQNLQEAADKADKCLLIVLTDIQLLLPNQSQPDKAFLSRQLSLLLNHPKYRILVLTHNKDHQKNNYFNKYFSFLPIAGMTESDIMNILKQQRTDLENFHHVVIPEELLSSTYTLTERYLSTSDTLDKTLLLLDSSAARASATTPDETAASLKPVLTMTTILNVLSGWTQIPISHLQVNTFKLSEFTQSMQQRVYGQDNAITLLGQVLQQSQANLQQSVGPFCSLLFTGNEHAGKRTMALALAEQLFKQLNVLYFSQPIASSINSILDIKLQRCTDKHYLSLKEVIHQTPYAIILFENIEQATPIILDGLYEILSTGLLQDDIGNQYNFRQSMMILSTTVGTKSLGEFSELLEPLEDNREIDLMQLIMNEQKNTTVAAKQDYSPQELISAVMPELTKRFSTSLCQYLHVIPFLPLTKAAIEKIIRTKLKLLGKMLDSRYGIELGYAPEVIRYLASEVLTKQDMDHQHLDIDKVLKQLYCVIEQAILSQADNKHRPNQLFLQLNETGKLLRCDWLGVTPLRQHSS